LTAALLDIAVWIISKSPRQQTLKCKCSLYGNRCWTYWHNCSCWLRFYGYGGKFYRKYPKTLYLKILILDTLWYQIFINTYLQMV